MERAYDDASTATSRAVLTLIWSSPRSPIPRRAAGKHVLSCFVQYAPYKLRPGLELGRSEGSFRRYGRQHHRRVRANIKDIILHRQVITPLDLNVSGAERRKYFSRRLSLEQLFFLRPAPGYARFARLSRISTCAARPLIRGGIMGAPDASPRWKC